MDEFNFQPAPNAAAGATAPFWQKALDDIFSLGTDVLRAKLIDAERPSDDANIPDQADLFYGFRSGSLTLGSSIVLALVVFGGGFLLFRALK